MFGELVAGFEKGQLFASLWRFLQLSVHEYGTSSAGELLVVLTIIILDRDGHRPTVMDLADLTGVAKSNVSRYVARQIRRGHLSESIDSDDRRRRIFTPTPAGRKELKRMEKQIDHISDAISSKQSDLYTTLVGFASSRPGT